jgi:hypothetical protein
MCRKTSLLPCFLHKGYSCQVAFRTLVLKQIILLVFLGTIVPLWFML